MRIICTHTKVAPVSLASFVLSPWDVFNYSDLPLITLSKKKKKKKKKKKGGAVSGLR